MYQSQPCVCVFFASVTQGTRRAAIVTAVYLAPGFGGGGDVPLVNLLKEFFKRGRPLASTHYSYSFPSGCDFNRCPHICQ